MKVRNYILCFIAMLFCSIPLMEVHAEDKSIPVSLSVSATPLNVTIPQSISLQVNSNSVSAIAANNYAITNNASIGTVRIDKVNVNVNKDWAFTDKTKDFTTANKDTKEMYLGLSLGADGINSMKEEYLPADNMIKALQQKSINIEAKTGIFSTSVINQNIADMVVTVGRDIIYDKYSISYNTNNGVMPGNYPIEYTELDALDLPVPTYTNYTFLGWCTDKELTSTPIPSIEKGTIGNKVLYAKWSANAYTITYDANGGTGAPEPQSFRFNEGEKLSTKVPTKDGYTFSGWDYSGNHFTPGQVIPDGMSSFSLTAKWSAIKYTLSYDSIGGVMPGSYIKEFTIIDTFDLPVPTYTNKTFLGWCTDKGLTSTPMKTFPKGLIGNKTLYAKWSPNTFYVTYDANGGAGAPATQAFKFESGDKISTQVPTKAGYKFAGWDYSGNHFNPGQAIPYNWASFTLIAQWEKEVYTVSVNFADGITPAKSISFESGMTWRQFVSSKYNTFGFVVFENAFVKAIKFNYAIVRIKTGVDEWGYPVYQGFEPDALINKSFNYEAS